MVGKSLMIDDLHCLEASMTMSMNLLGLIWRGEGMQEIIAVKLQSTTKRRLYERRN